MDQALVKIAPLLLPISPDGSAFEGYLSPCAECSTDAAALWLRLTGVPRAGAGACTLRGVRLEVNAALAELLDGCGDVLAARLAESTSLAAFLVELRSILDHAWLERAASVGSGGAAGERGSMLSGTRPAAFYRHVHEELCAVGWERVASLAPDLSTLTLLLSDQRGRPHELRLSLPPDYPASAPAIAADLPLPFEPRRGHGGGLPGLVAEFQAALAGYQELWNHLDDLDQHAWVVEPSNPPRSCTTRRLALGGHVTLTLTLNPARPSAPPACQLAGADAAVAPLRAALHAHAAARWREDVLLRHNLEAVLEHELPCRQLGGAEDISADCAICYAYRLALPEEEAGEGKVPDVSCDNTQCSKPFHRACLLEWLRSDTTTRQSFNTLYGTCPYCSAAITVKML